MDVRRVKEEMQFLTNTVTSDVDYLLYLLLKKTDKQELESKIPTTDTKSFSDEEVLDDWFDQL